MAAKAKKAAVKAKPAAKKASAKPAAKKPAAAKQPEISSDLRKVALAHALRRLT
jgi:hypothetical protein